MDDHISKIRRLKYAPHYATFRWAHFSTCCRLRLPPAIAAAPHAREKNHLNNTHTSQPSSFCRFVGAVLFIQPCANWIFQVVQFISSSSSDGDADDGGGADDGQSRRCYVRKLNIFLAILVGKMVMVFNFITSVFIIICFISGHSLFSHVSVPNSHSHCILRMTRQRNESEGETVN